MRVLVCGSRTWEDRKVIYAALLGWSDNEDPYVVMHGGAPGADACAKEWAEVFCHHSEHHQFPADWATHGKAAGPIRNQQMLDEGKPDVVFAFKDGFDIAGRGGTEDMVRRAKAAGIPVYIVSHA